MTKCFLKNRKLYGNAGWFIGLPRTNTSIIAIFAKELPQYAGLDVKGLYVIYQKSLIAVKKVWEKEDMKEEAASDTGPQGSAEFDSSEGATNALDSADKIEPMDPEHSGEKTFGSDVKYVNSLERVLEVADPSPAPAQDASPVTPSKGEREDSVLEPAEKGTDHLPSPDSIFWHCWNIPNCTADSRMSQETHVLWLWHSKLLAERNRTILGVPLKRESLILLERLVGKYKDRTRQPRSRNVLLGRKALRDQSKEESDCTRSHSFICRSFARCLQLRKS